MINLVFKKFHKGASLIELLIYIGLLSIILLVAIDLMIRSGEFSLEASSKNNLQGDTLFIEDRLSYDIHQADDITSPATLGEVSQTLTLEVGTETHTYGPVGTDLVYTRETSPPGSTTETASINSNLTKINSISFQRIGSTDGKHTIKIVFEIEVLKGSKGGAVKKTFETVVGLR